MSELHHRIKVFVYRFEQAAPHYLLLKPDQGIEALWGPSRTSSGSARSWRARSANACGTRWASTSGRLLDLDMPGRWTLGDEEIIEWTFGFRARGRVRPELLEGTFAAHRWARFQDAYSSMGLELDRQAAMRLHSACSLPDGRAQARKRSSSG